MDTSKEIRILASVFEFRQLFEEPWLDLWSSPGGMAGKLIAPFRKYGVELRDIAFYPSPANFSEQSLTVAFRKINTVVKIGLDSVSVIASNPSLDSMATLDLVIEGLLGIILSVIGRPPLRQEADLSLHIMADGLAKSEGTARLIRTDLLGEAQFYAVGVYR